MSFNNGVPSVVIVEQPSSKSTRFRYECERRYNNHIHGESGKDTYPTIRILNYKGPLSIFVSCVTEDAPYAAHPHKLATGSDVHENGICYFRVSNNEHNVSFQNLSVQSIGRKNIAKSLEARERAQLDPFKTGFQHKLTPKAIDLNCVRLCFQVVLESNGGKIPLEPIVSNPIYDKKNATDLKIVWMSHNIAQTTGGFPMIILCGKVSKGDVEVRFFNEDNEWEAVASDLIVYKQVSLSFKTPEYKISQHQAQNIIGPVNVKVQLRRISNGETSESVPFQFSSSYYDNDEEENHENRLKRKRREYSGPCGDISRKLQTELSAHPDFKSFNKLKMNIPMQPQQQQTPNMNIVRTEPWELPTREPMNMQSYLQQTNCRPINNFMNVPREQSAVCNSPSENQYYNMQPTLFDEPIKSENQPQENQDPANSFSFDRWLTDLKEIFCQEAPANNYCNPTTNNIACEPETLASFMNQTTNVPECDENMTTSNNAFNANIQQTHGRVNNLDFIENTTWRNKTPAKTNDFDLNVNPVDVKCNTRIGNTQDIFLSDELNEISRFCQ